MNLPMKIKLSFFVFLSVFSITAELQLNNWRSWYYITATEMESAKNPGAPSNMFWDNMTKPDLFNNALWPDSAKLARNHLFIEPQIAFETNTQYPDSQDALQNRIGLLNSIRFRNFYIRQTLNVDKAYSYDPVYPAHRERAMRGRIEEAFLEASWKYGFFRLGRLNRNWGPFADRSMFLSANPYTYDAFEWQLHSKYFEFRHLFAAFSLEKSQWDTYNNPINRYFTAHALNVIFGKWVTLGVFETVVFSREKGFPDLAFVNPFNIYTVANTNQENIGNLMLGFQWNIHPFTEKISLRGQLIFDDFQVDDEVVTDKEPAHWGIDMGIYLKDLIPVQFRNLMSFDYNFRSKWLYTVPDFTTEAGERYTYYSKSLGYKENDGHHFGGSVTLIGKNFWAGSVFGSHDQKNGNTVVSKWNDNTHTPGLPFDSLSLPRQKQISAGINAFGYFKRYADIKLSLGANWIKNRNNTASSNYEVSPLAGVLMSIHFSDLIIKLPD
jgi:hypothetical protein